MAKGTHTNPLRFAGRSGTELAYAAQAVSRASETTDPTRYTARWAAKGVRPERAAYKAYDSRHSRRASVRTGTGTAACVGVSECARAPDVAYQSGPVAAAAAAAAASS